MRRLEWQRPGGGLDSLQLLERQFTCDYSTRGMTARERFHTDLISSNRLLADNDYLRRQIGKVRTGDQIRVRGWLANYSNDRGFARASSVTGDGRGDGACETVCVREFSILQPLQDGWCRLLVVAVPGFSCGAGVRGVAVMRG